MRFSIKRVFIQAWLEAICEVMVVDDEHHLASTNKMIPIMFTEC